MYKVQNYNVGDTIFEVIGPIEGKNFNCWDLTPVPTPYIRRINDSTATIQCYQGLARQVTSDASGINLVNIDFVVPDNGWTLIASFAPGITDLAVPYYNQMNHLKFVLNIAGYGVFFARCDYK